MSARQQKRDSTGGANSTTTRTASGLDFTAKGGKSQGRAVPQSLWVKPGAKAPALEIPINGKITVGYIVA